MKRLVLPAVMLLLAGHAAGGERISPKLERLAAMEADGAAPAQIAPLFDDFLMSLPVKKRYTPENIERFVRYAGTESVSFGDIVKNWGRFPLTAQQGAALTNKVDALAVNSMIRRLGEEMLHDFSAVCRHADRNGGPFSGPVIRLFRLWESCRKHDSRLSVSLIRSMFADNIELSTMGWGVLEALMDRMLDMTDGRQSREMADILTTAAQSVADVSALGVIKRTIDNFEGKAILIEMGLE